MTTALWFLSLSVSFVFGWSASRLVLCKREADRGEDRFWMRESLTLTPEETVRASEGR